MPSRINIGPENGPYVAINESSGNLQLEDNSGNVVAEWDETNAQWDFANNTLSNVDALNSNSVSTEEQKTSQGTLWNRESNDTFGYIGQLAIVEEASEITSTSFTSVAAISGTVDLTEVPEGATAYGRFVFLTEDPIDQDYDVEVRIDEGADGEAFNFVSLDELTVSVSSTETLTIKDSGWQEIVTVSDTVIRGNAIRARLDEQTNGDSITAYSNIRAGVQFKWRLD